MVALCLTAVLGFGALAVDFSWVRVNDIQLETALEAGALAGAGYLDGTPEAVDLAIVKAVEIAQQNGVTAGVTFGPEHVLVGDWDPDARTFTPYGTWDEATAGNIDAVRMSVEMDDIPAILAGITFRRTSFTTLGDALAYRPVEVVASKVPCFLPIALPACMFPEDPTTNPPPIAVHMGTSPTDNVGWALPEGINAKEVRKHLLNECSDELSTSDHVEVQNGIISNAVATMADVINGKKGQNSVWDETLLGPLPDRTDANVAFPKGETLIKDKSWGNVLEGPIALVDIGGEPGTCAGAEQFNGTRKVAGFTWAAIYDARKENAKTSGFMIQLDYVNEREFGTESSPDAVGSVTTSGGRPSLVY